MKRSLFTALLLLSGAGIYGQKFNFGIKGSFGRTTLEPTFENPDFNFESKGRLAVRIAGFAEYRINEKFAIQAEIAPSVLGGKYVYENEDKEMVNKISLKTLNFPLMFKYYPVPEFNLNAGTEVGFSD